MSKIHNYINSMNTLAVILLCYLFFWVGAPKADTIIPLSKGQTVYVPIYSHIYSGHRESPFHLVATLSIRNTDHDNSLTITAIDYFDSEGNFVKNYLKNNKALKPMASTRFIVKAKDKAGSGAKFIIKWEADKQIIPPIIESIMIGTQAQQGVSFTSRGMVIEEK